MTTITIEGLDALEQKLGRMAAIDVLKSPMHKATKRIYAQTQIYPPASGKPMQWKSVKQRRWFFANLNDGNIEVPYRRKKSGGLAGSWVERVTVRNQTLVGIVGTDISYGPLVMHPDKQAEYHRGNWPTTDDIVSKHRRAIVNDFKDAIRRAINE